MKDHYGLWMVSIRATSLIFSNVDTEKKVRKHGWSLDDAHSFIDYLNSRTTMPIFRIGGPAHGKLKLP